MSDSKSLAAASVVNVARAHISPAAVPVGRKRIALGIAILADALQAGMFPIFVEGALSPYQDALDIAIAVILTLTLGFRWRLVMAFLAELLPGFSLFPSWTAVVLSLPTLPAPEPSDAPKDVITVTPVHPELPPRDSAH
jgi:hypothetical protein